ncbi:unnamed protein product [Vitrella brassicaformis CCMP3155]|uniref:Uncharacterized protein n=1 Tax=Vitrella brassicaformis (strain CCMP3155) TaxID=1169540 RepID=A0A0G4EPJ2_VITBC|nr:unnamed protein product [Vitrella brassicaformis CCMP3155]|eukprot:CEL99180.1 unnamed protein product [Vitrella brassicaformis CCMP3155]
MFAKRGKANFKKRAVEEEDEHDGEGDEERAELERASKAAKKSTVSATTKDSNKKAWIEDDIVVGGYKTTRELNLHQDQKAFAVSEIDTERDRDHRAILERNYQIGQELKKGSLEENVYRGLHAYKPIANQSEGAIRAGKYTGLMGPVRSQAHIRISARFDYQPDICKDYKETGYCGFGDTCKFIHDRGDYKSGWQLEKEWDEQQKKKQEKLQKLIRGDKITLDEDDDDSDDDDDDDDDEGLPFACLLCRTPWSLESRPVVTLCKHYFCEKCAFEHYSKSSKCAVCQRPTNGIFNSADKILEKLQKKQADAGADGADAGAAAAAQADAGEGEGEGGRDEAGEQGEDDDD